MTLDERCKHYRNELRRYKRKYLNLRLKLARLFRDIVECSYDIDTNTVVDVNDIMKIIDKYMEEN